MPPATWKPAEESQDGGGVGRVRTGRSQRRIRSGVDSRRDLPTPTSRSAGPAPASTSGDHLRGILKNASLLRLTTTQSADRQSADNWIRRGTRAGAGGRRLAAHAVRFEHRGSTDTTALSPRSAPVTPPQGTAPPPFSRSASMASRKNLITDTHSADERSGVPAKTSRSKVKSINYLGRLVTRVCGTSRCSSPSLSADGLPSRPGGSDASAAWSEVGTRLSGTLSYSPSSTAVSFGRARSTSVSGSRYSAHQQFFTPRLGSARSTPRLNRTASSFSTRGGSLGGRRGSGAESDKESCRSYVSSARRDRDSSCGSVRRHRKYFRSAESDGNDSSSRSSDGAGGRNAAVEAFRNPHLSKRSAGGDMSSSQVIRGTSGPQRASSRKPYELKWEAGAKLKVWVHYGRKLPLPPEVVPCFKVVLSGRGRERVSPLIRWDESTELMYFGEDDLRIFGFDINDVSEVLFEGKLSIRILSEEYEGCWNGTVDLKRGKGQLHVSIAVPLPETASSHERAHNRYRPSSRLHCAAGERYN